MVNWLKFCSSTVVFCSLLGGVISPVCAVMNPRVGFSSMHSRTHSSSRSLSHHKVRSHKLKIPLLSNAKDRQESLRELSLKARGADAVHAAYDEGQIFFLQKNFQAAIETWSDLLNRFPQNPLCDQVYHSMSLAYSALHDRENALLCLDHLINDRGEVSAYYHWALLAKADLLFQDKNYASSEEIYSQILKAQKPASVQSLVLLRLSQIAIEVQSLNRAQFLVEKLLSDYPHSLQADEAKRLLNQFKSAPPSRWSLQVGAFRRQANAIALHKKLKDKGYAGFVLSSRNQAGWIHKVRVGPFDSKDKALNSAKRLKSQEHIKASVVYGD